MIALSDIGIAKEQLAIANEWRAEAARSTTAQLEALVNGRTRLKQAGGWLAISIAKDELAKRAAAATPIVKPIIRTVAEITAYRLAQLGLACEADLADLPTPQIDDFKTTVAADWWSDLALSGWSSPDGNSERRQREVERYHNSAWRELLNNYLALREQLKHAKQVQSATPPPGPAWSAFARYVKGLKSVRASSVNSLTRKVAAARKALGQPIVVWKRRPLIAPKPKVTKPTEYARAA